MQASRHRHGSAASVTSDIVFARLGVRLIAKMSPRRAASQRRDIGVRLALGATKSNVRVRFVRQALAFAGAGVVI